MLIAFTYLPGFVTLVFRGMPTVWRGRHRLIFCWLIFMQAVHPGQTPPTPGLRLCIIKPTGFLRLFRECYPCFSRYYRLCPRKKVNFLNDALA